MAIPSIINGDHQLLDNDMAIDVMVNIIITDENLWSTHGHTLNQLQMPLSLPMITVMMIMMMISVVINGDW